MVIPPIIFFLTRTLQMRTSSSLISLCMDSIGIEIVIMERKRVSLMWWWMLTIWQLSTITVSCVLGYWLDWCSFLFWVGGFGANWTCDLFSHISRNQVLRLLFTFDYSCCWADEIISFCGWVSSLTKLCS